jgi:hypothetical protein
MRRSLKKLLFQSRIYIFCFAFTINGNIIGQIANYVNNGSFEQTVNTIFGKYPVYWGATDSTKAFGELITGPSSGFAYQIPRSGNNVWIFLQYFTSYSTTTRAYPRNRLKNSLEVGVQYCVTMYVNLSHQSTHGISNTGLYLADSSIDTIKKCTIPITYLTPQVENPTNNVITDTLNWVKVSGKYTAIGTEKYIMIGNFYSDSATNKILVNPTNLPVNAADYLIDDVSLIEVDLPAYAGSDAVITPGDSAFIGREPDFAIDPGCRWYRLPGMEALDTISGMWVKPALTTTYVVRQELECSAEKWDTVVVHVNLTRLDELNMLEAQISVFPVPATAHLEVRVSNDMLKTGEAIKELRIVNNLGQLIREEEIVFTNNIASVNTSDFPEGVYTLELKTGIGTLRKRFVIAR